MAYFESAPFCTKKDFDDYVHYRLRACSLQKGELYLAMFAFIGEVDYEGNEAGVLPITLNQHIQDPVHTTQHMLDIDLLGEGLKPVRTKTVILDADGFMVPADNILAFNAGGYIMSYDVDRTGFDRSIQELLDS